LYSERIDVSAQSTNWGLDHLLGLHLRVGCGPSQEAINREKEKQREAYERAVNDEKALMPTGFRSRYRPWSDDMFSMAEVSFNVFWHRTNPLLRTIWLLGLVLYPVWCCGAVWLVEGPPNNSEEFWGVAIGGTLICFVANVVLSWVLYGLSYLVLSLTSAQDVHVHWNVISFGLHAVVHLMGLALVVSLGLLALVRAASAGGRSGSQQPVVPPASGRRRVRFAVRAMLKAFFVAIATGVGSQIGGWLGGILVFVLATGAAALLGGEVSAEHQE
jgi:hypothetical protein